MDEDMSVILKLFIDLISKYEIGIYDIIRSMVRGKVDKAMKYASNPIERPLIVPLLCNFCNFEIVPAETTTEIAGVLGLFRKRFFPFGNLVFKNNRVYCSRFCEHSFKAGNQFPLRYCVLQGLKNKSQFNKEKVKLLKYNPKNQRWKVALRNGENFGVVTRKVTPKENPCIKPRDEIKIKVPVKSIWVTAEKLSPSPANFPPNINKILGSNSFMETRKLSQTPEITCLDCNNFVDSNGYCRTCAPLCEWERGSKVDARYDISKVDDEDAKFCYHHRPEYDFRIKCDECGIHRYGTTPPGRPSLEGQSTLIIEAKEVLKDFATIAGKSELHTVEET